MLERDDRKMSKYTREVTFCGNVKEEDKRYKRRDKH